MHEPYRVARRTISLFRALIDRAPFEQTTDCWDYGAEAAEYNEACPSTKPYTSSSALPSLEASLSSPFCTKSPQTPRSLGHLEMLGLRSISRSRKFGGYFPKASLPSMWILPKLSWARAD